MTQKEDKNNLEHKTEEKDSTLVEIARSIKTLLGSDSNYGRYFRNGCGCFAAGYIALYCGHPVTTFISFPILAVGGYNFIQALRHRDELLKKEYEEFRRKYKEEREKRRKNRDN